ncbi:hypothetical protein PVL29_020247 [Vitis rotundifolia]|uniref:Uncharacterized protein n=1 Tax=Vitis rotundifolia TaxID=103349 RepID=A0AA38Z2X4_VITRO|nr:hypothetical protein PVL29_020247 [Vitis rotundifolia]
MKNYLQALIERARALNEKVSDEINTSCSSFCRFCSESGCYCGDAETPFEERQRLIAIGDSLKNVEKMLVFLQKLESWQHMDQNSALAQLEESRLFLIQKVTQHQGRSLQVLEELNALFGNGESGFGWNLKEKMEEKGDADNGQKRSSNFFISCFQILVHPWKWKKAAGIAVRLIAVSVSISSTIHLYRTRQQYRTSQTKFLALMNSKEAGKNEFLFTTPNSPLDVFFGRG